MEVAMTENLDAGMVALKGIHKVPDGFLLGRRSRVLRGLSVFRKTPDVHDADAIGVVAGDMCADISDIPAGLNRPVKTHNEMIANPIEAPLSVPTINVSRREGFSFRSGRTVDDNLGNFSQSKNSTVIR